jgi:hypothetical protein
VTSARSILGTFAALAALSVVACAAAPTEEAESSDSALASRPYDKNLVVYDAAFADVSMNAPDVAKIQAFLDTTPFRNFFLLRTTSPLAAYRDGGKLASEILVDVAREHRINPLALLVALEAESSLVSATDLDEERMKVAFRCVCPGTAACQANPDRFVGFTKQAACYAGTMRKALDAQSEGRSTEKGWKRGAPKETGDKPAPLLVTPRSFATAALYDWSPVVGRAGGGDRALGGTSNWYALWTRFGTAIEYEGPTAASSPPGTTAPPEDPDACQTSDRCPDDAPVCDATSKRCVACTADFGSGGARACSTSTSPVCASGACAPCSATKVGACALTNSTPQCVTGIFSDPKCGCSADDACGAGRICDDDLGPAGICAAGCRVRGGKDSCGALGRCSVRSGGIGVCTAVTACTATSCPTGFRCDLTLAMPTCIRVDEPPPSPSPSPAADAGASAADAGASSALSELPAPESAAPQQLPSGHREDDRSRPTAKEPEFAPLTDVKPRESKSGCSAAPSRGSGSQGGLLAFGLFSLVAMGLRARRRSR